MRISTLKTTVSAFAIAVLAGTAAFAADTDVKTTKQNPAPASAVVKGSDKDGNTKFQNNAYITISGTVGKITDEDEFQLIHSGGTIDVDTNDAWPDMFQADAATLLKTGDHVTVTGKVDNNLFSTNEIEAYSIAVATTGYDRVYTNDKYAPDSAAYNSTAYGAGLEDDQKVRLSGTISRVMDDGDFMLRYGNGEIRVEGDDVDFTNASKLAVGDEVVVFGEVDKDWFQKKTVEADRIILSRAYSQIVQ